MPFTQQPFQKQPPRHSEAEENLLQEKIQSMIGKSAIGDTTPKGHSFMSTVFLVPKSETSNQSKKSEQVCSHRTLQNGGHPCLEKPAKSRKSDDKSGPEGCILHSANTPEEQSLLQIHFQGKDVPIQMPAFRPSMCPMGLHQDPKATRCSVDTTGNVTNCLHR